MKSLCNALEDLGWSFWLKEGASCQGALGEGRVLPNPGPPRSWPALGTRESAYSAHNAATVHLVAMERPVTLEPRPAC